MKTRKEELKDLYYAIKQNLSKRMSELKAIQRATNLTVRVEQDESMTIEDIRAMRDKYLKGEKLERPNELNTISDVERIMKRAGACSFTIEEII